MSKYFLILAWRSKRINKEEVSDTAPDLPDKFRVDAEGDDGVEEEGEGHGIG